MKDQNEGVIHNYEKSFSIFYQKYYLSSVLNVKKRKQIKTENICIYHFQKRNKYPKSNLEPSKLIFKSINHDC